MLSAHHAECSRRALARAAALGEDFGRLPTPRLQRAFTTPLSLYHQFSSVCFNTLSLVSSSFFLLLSPSFSLFTFSKFDSCLLKSSFLSVKYEDQEDLVRLIDCDQLWPWRKPNSGLSNILLHLTSLPPSLHQALYMRPLRVRPKIFNEKAIFLHIMLPNHRNHYLRAAPR